MSTLILEVIAETELPEGSRLHTLYTDRQRAQERSSSSDTKLSNLQSELATVRAWLQSATLDTVTPMDFAQETAREVLLSRAMSQADRDALRAAESYEGARREFSREYSTYAQNVRALRAGQLEGVRLDLSQIEDLERQVSRAVGV